MSTLHDNLRVCEIMGTGSGPAIQNPDDIDDWPVPVPIFSQSLSPPVNRRRRRGRRGALAVVFTLPLLFVGYCTGATRRWVAPIVARPSLSWKIRNSQDLRS